jgi:hypothetical protein
LKKTTTILLASSALALTACGGDDETSEESEAAVTPEVAIEEIAAVRAGLDQALAEYTGGDAETAAEIVEETYLQHFELVEGPLEEADAELNEELEDEIREELVDEIESNASVAEVKDLVAQIESGLDEAEAALNGAGAG